jgi:hypothetical protein
MCRERFLERAKTQKSQLTEKSYRAENQVFARLTFSDIPQGRSSSLFVAIVFNRLIRRN